MGVRDNYEIRSSEERFKELEALPNKVHLKIYRLCSFCDNTTIGEIAKAVGVSRQAFDAYIRAKKPVVPGVMVLLHMSEYFGVPARYLLDNTIPYRRFPYNMSIPDQSDDTFQGDRVVSAAVMTDALKRTNLAERKAQAQFLKDCGLTNGALLLLTPEAKSALTAAVKDCVNTIAVDDNNWRKPRFDEDGATIWDEDWT